MNISGTKTELNLAKSFAAESQSQARYEVYAEAARKEGFYYLGEVFNKLGRQELSHAREFLEKLNMNKPEKPSNINVGAGYPFEFADTLANLQASSKHERDLAEDIYPAFAQDAQQEGFADISRLFEEVAAVERDHSALETALHTAMAQGKLYSSDTPVKWKCSNCGHEATADEPWLVCPLCSHAQGFVIPQAAMLN